MGQPLTREPTARRFSGLVLGLGVLALGTGSIFARLADAPPLVVSFWRCAVAALLLALFHAAALRREAPALSRRDVAEALLAGLLLALHFAAWITSLEWTSVSASVLLVSTHPLWVGLLAPLLTVDRMTRRTAFAIAACLVGTAVIASADASGPERALAGDGLALAGGLAAALYLLSGRRLRARLSLGTYATLCYGSAAAFLLIFALLAGQPLGGHTTQTWGWLAACGLVPQLLGHTSMNWALRWATAPLVAISMMGEPIVATLLAWAILGEAPVGAVLTGGSAILVGITVAGMRPR